MHLMADIPSRSTFHIRLYVFLLGTNPVLSNLPYNLPTSGAHYPATARKKAYGILASSGKVISSADRLRKNIGKTILRYAMSPNRPESEQERYPACCVPSIRNGNFCNFACDKPPWHRGSDRLR